MTTSPVRAIDPMRPAPEAIMEAVEVMKDGKVVAYPTETLYGLGADALSAAAVERVFALKGRPEGQPIPILIRDAEMLEAVVVRVPEEARALASAFWPGPLTMVLEAASVVPAWVTGGGGSVGVRISAHPVAASLVAAMGSPITTTSANRSGRAGARSAGQIEADFPAGLGLILDAGALAESPASTVLDLTSGAPRVIRAGVISPEEIRAALEGRHPAAER